ncbi:MAG: GTP 3',8-cyclase MoaA [Phycisphaeraceae bacterium]
MMQDAQGRRLRYLRLSITRACGMRCTYCRPAGSTPLDDDQPLTPREIEALVRHLVAAHGLRKVRLTGGEPTTRHDLPEIITRLSDIAGLQDLALTTNGLTLARQARSLAQAGLRRVNISLDSLEEHTFHQITGVAGLQRVLAGIAAAHDAGLAPIKLNTVVLRGANDHELPDLLRFAAQRSLEIRFIELMPMGPLAQQWAQRFVPESEMRQRLAADTRSWTPQPRGAGSARTFHATLTNGASARVGFITAMSCPFCDQCDRLRIGADGSLYPCLMARPTGTLRHALRPLFDAQRFDHILAAGLATKAPQHPATGFGIMTQIGG